MSEFFFDYKCISMGETLDGKKNDKALDFYLFQNYEDDSMCVQINVPKSMQEKYVLAKLYYSYNGVTFPTVNASTTPLAIWYIGNRDGTKTDESNFIDNDNSVFLRSQEKELSGCGVLAFVRKGEENLEPRIDDCYKFIVNYTKKELISYRIVESKGRIRVEVYYPLIKSEVRLCIVQKKGAKPVLEGDRENRLKYIGKDEEVSIVLKANGRKNDVYKGSFKVRDASQFDYRLSFENESDGRYYLLVDESDYTLEDKSLRMIERLKNDAGRQEILRCPYCGRRLVKYEKYKKGETAIVGCDGKLITNVVADDRLKGKLTLVCSADLVKESSPAGVDRGYVEANNLIIPEHYTDRPSMNLVVGGFPKSGKTIYLSSLFNMSNGGTERGITSHPFILNKIVKAYDVKGKKKPVAEEVKFYNVDINNHVLSDVCERMRSSPREDIKRRYVMTVGDDVEGQTAKSDVAKLSWNPIAYEMGNLGYIYFYDIPGECFTQDNRSEVRALDMADCILAVINGSNEVKDPLGELMITLEHIPMLSRKNLDMENIPIAIVFTKHDIKLVDYVEDKTQKEFCFDPNCHVVREDIIDLLPKNGVYEGSELERHIDCSSYELEHYLKARDKNDNYKRLKEKYKNVRFFTCSALGNDACLGKPKDGTKEVLFRPRRLRVELPIIWLMYKKGLIGR